MQEALAVVRRFAPKLAEVTVDTLFGDVLQRPGLDARDRALITVSALITGGHVDQLRFHGPRARALGVSRAELAEVVLQLAFYAGWPRAMSALAVLDEALAATSDGVDEPESR